MIITDNNIISTSFSIVRTDLNKVFAKSGNPFIFKMIVDLSKDYTNNGDTPFTDSYDLVIECATLLTLFEGVDINAPYFEGYQNATQQLTQLISDYVLVYELRPQLQSMCYKKIQDLQDLQDFLNVQKRNAKKDYTIKIICYHCINRFIYKHKQTEFKKVFIEKVDKLGYIQYIPVKKELGLTCQEDLKILDYIKAMNLTIRQEAYLKARLEGLSKHSTAKKLKVKYESVRTTFDLIGEKLKLTGIKIPPAIVDYLTGKKQIRIQKAAKQRQKQTSKK